MSGAKAGLRAAWSELIASLEAAREAIDDPMLHAPPPSDRTLAEGYRYLLGFVYGAIGRALDDPHFPHFRRAIEPTDKSTIDNADAVYLYAPIDGAGSYVIRGRPDPGRQRPHYVIFETPSGYAGDSGSIAELEPGTRANGGVLDSSRLQVEADGSFEILLAPERPAGHAGNFLSTRAQRRGVEYTSRWVVLRELFHDWEHEDPLDLSIARVGSEGSHPPPLDPARAAALLRRVGTIANHQMRYWNEFYAVTLETHRDMNGDGQQFMPRNALNAPRGAGHWGGQATNLYAGGTYDLCPDEALVIETRVPVAPAYSGFHLANFWGESHDFANHQSSLNGFQAEVDADGARRYVVAHRDPGVPNWVDTTGLPQGFMSFRWAYSEPPGELPATRVAKVAFDAIRSHLPSDVRAVSSAERRAAIRIRQAHVQRRYRHY
jgi:hypothetical protein